MHSFVSSISLINILLIVGANLSFKQSILLPIFSIKKSIASFLS